MLWNKNLQDEVAAAESRITKLLGRSSEVLSIVIERGLTGFGSLSEGKSNSVLPILSLR